MCSRFSIRKSTFVGDTTSSFSSAIKRSVAELLGCELLAPTASEHHSEFVADCKALGLIDKLVTGPLWRTLEESSISILDMSAHYSEMLEMFESWSVDASSLLSGNESLPDGKEIADDPVRSRNYPSPPHCPTQNQVGIEGERPWCSAGFGSKPSKFLKLRLD